MSSGSSNSTADFEPLVETVSLDQPQPFSSLVRVDFGGQSHVGKVRSNNEDSFLIYRTGRYWERVLTSLPGNEVPERYEDNAYVMAVADGMGGAAAGEVASSMALRAAVNLIIGAAKWAIRLDDPEHRETEIKEAKERVFTILRKIDQTLTQHARNDEQLLGMGTTLTATYSVGDNLFTLQIGDSRAYLYRKGKIQQLTNDHTMAQTLARLGAITQEEAARHHLRHVLTRALGTQGGGEIDAEINEYRLVNGDRVMVCSDGLTEMVKDEQIQAILGEEGNAQSACRKLVEAALNNGGKDNITVTLAGYAIPPRPGQG